MFSGILIEISWRFFEENERNILPFTKALKDPRLTGVRRKKVIRCNPAPSWFMNGAYSTNYVS